MSERLLRLWRDRRGTLLLLAALATILLWPAPYFEALRSPNELVRVYSTRAMFDDGTLHLDAQVKRWGPLTDRAQHDGHIYSDKAPGLSLLAVPIYGGLRLFFAADDIDNALLVRLYRVLLIVLPTLLWLSLLALWLERLGVSARIGDSLVVALAIGSPAFAYCLTFVGHQASAWMLGIAAYAAWRGRAGAGRWRAAAGLLGGLAAITEYPTAPMLPLLAALTLWRAPAWRVGLLWFGAAALLPLAAGAAYHTAAFGGPFTTGYEALADPGFKKVHEEGLVGVGLPSLRALAALSFGTQRGLFWLAPWILIAPLGLLELLRPRATSAASGDRSLLVAVLGANLLLAALVASGFGYWLGGWSVGPRHMVSALPAAALLAAFAWQRLPPWLDAAVRGLVLGGVCIMAAVAFTYPGFPEELTDPIAELSLPLLARLQHPQSIGLLLGLRSDLAMLPAIALAAALGTWVVLGAPRRVALSAWHGVALAGWIAVALVVCLLELASPPSREAVFRVAWLTQSVWQPQDVERGLDARLAAWEPARRDFAKNRIEPTHFRAIGAVEAYRGEQREALVGYARAAWPARAAVPRAP